MDVRSEDVFEEKANVEQSAIEGDSASGRLCSVVNAAAFDDVSLLECNTNECGMNQHQILTTQEAKSPSNESRSSSSQEMFSMGSTPLGTPISVSLENLNKLDDKFATNAAITKISNGLNLNLKVIEERYEQKLCGLQREKNELSNEIEALRTKLQKQEEEFSLTVNEVKSQSNVRLERAIKQAESSRKDLESMVVKYAKSEKEVIILKKNKEELEKKLRDSLKDKESLQIRIKGLSTDKSSLMSSLDKKLADCAVLQKEIEKMKDEVKDRDSKWKHCQIKLKEEYDSHASTRHKLDCALKRIEDLKAENEQLRSEVYEHKVERVNNECNNDTSSELGSEASSTEPPESETALKKFAEYEKENHALTVKVQSLERERLDHEVTVSKLKETLNELRSEIMDYNQKLSNLEEVKVSLDREKEINSAMQKELNRLKEANTELLSEMEICRHKEGELLEFTERLTAKTVNLQSEHNILEQKCATLQDEVNRYAKKSKEEEEECEKLRKELISAQEKYQNEVNLLARKVAEKTKLIEDLRSRVDEVENENKVMKKRHINSVKELNKELLLMKKRVEGYESHGQQNSESVSMGSRTSSSTSLEASVQQPNGSPPNNTVAAIQQEIGIIPKAFELVADTLPQLDKQMLIYKFIKLQKTLAKRQEKIDFLEEHNHQLLEEMKKKTKLIQYYILREETGALTTNKMDENKKQLSKKGAGIMASLYSSTQSDASMTVDLLLEINKKLQAVLEDTLLKNITLKENINTLGDEIARLTSSQCQCNKSYSMS
ncbi:hypothetical protein B4U79_12622 [Dinothrombium tinctorium]|uniref:Uncharacterized protein n=1 Tax=Dinothrombium tinctorium TaxID=1965070 RepID=A0A443RF75_9ACAR|nr:hypothetical protein B4U79_10812 [Dinothrombium tinctorium]RWS13936.1 hypothetical protein B4U79_12622 [Dinothrombium tinctorium]